MQSQIIIASLTSPKASSGGTYEREGVEGGVRAAGEQLAAAWRG